MPTEQEQAPKPNEPIASKEIPVIGSPHSVLAEIEAELSKIGHLPIQFAAFLRAKLAELRSKL